MATGEIYVKLAVNFANDPKVRALARFGPDAGYARDLFVQMICYCKSQLTDGFVPAEQVGILVYPLPADHGNQLAKQLALVGLTRMETKDGADGWLVLAFVPRNGTKADVERLSAVRAEAGRRGGRPAGQSRSKSKMVSKPKPVANDAKSKANPYTETESETDTYKNPPPSEGGAGGDATQASPKRGTRIPGDFTVTPDMVAWASTKCPHVDGRAETEKFVNYWQAKSGRDACKLDWPATWRNWMLTAAERTGHPPNGHRPSTTDQRVAQAQQLKTQLRERTQP